MRFDESSMLKKLENQTKENGILQHVEHSQQQVEFEITTLHLTRSVEKNDGNPVIEEDLRDGGEGSAQESQQQLESIAVTKPRRELRRLARYNDTVAYALPIVDDVPSTHKEAVMCSEAKKWKTTMEEEMQSLQNNETWGLAQLPEGKKAIGYKWVFTKKEGFPDKYDVHYKARLCSEGRN